MKWFIGFSAICTALFGSIQAEEFPVQEVLTMAEKDSGVRRDWIRTRDIAQIRAQERENTARLKEIIARHGLPNGYEAEIEELVEAIEQLVLHSSDLDFQKQILEKIAHSCDLWDDTIDLLTDRVLLRQGLPQRYGTHVYHKDGLLVPYPIEDLEKVDDCKADSEPSFAETLEALRDLDRAIVQKNDSDFYKVIFNGLHNFYRKPSDYLYYASFQSHDAIPEREGIFLAFEDPGLATAFALQGSPLLTGASYEPANETYPEHLLVSISPQNVDDVALFCGTRLYISLVPRTHFQPNGTLSNRLLTSSERVEPVVEMSCDSVAEALVMSGSRIRIQGSGTQQEYKDTEAREIFLELFLFDVTLENECFDPM